MDFDLIINTIHKYTKLEKEFEDYGYSLKKDGRATYKTRCPFHNEKTPSMTIYEDTQTFHCFGCKEFGDIIKLTQHELGLTWMESVKFLIQKYSIPLDLENQQENIKDKELKETLRIVFEYFKIQLDKYPEYNKIVTDRKLDKNIYEFGFAPKNWLIELKNVKLDNLLELGLIAKKENTYYELMSNRFIIPFKNVSGEIIALNGRDVTGINKPKYYHTRGFDSFNKSQYLFGLEKFFKQKDKNEIYIVEGIFDVFKCWQNNISAISVNGSAITEQHAHILNKWDKIILMMDGDQAGVKAMLHVFKKIPNIQEKTFVIELPDNLDPDEYFSKYNTLPKEITLVDFAYKHLFKNLDLNSEVERNKIKNSINKDFLEFIVNKNIKNKLEYDINIYLGQHIDKFTNQNHNIKKEPFELIFLNMVITDSQLLDDIKSYTFINPTLNKVLNDIRNKNNINDILSKLMPYSKNWPSDKSKLSYFKYLKNNLISENKLVKG